MALHPGKLMGSGNSYLYPVRGLSDVRNLFLAFRGSVVLTERISFEIVFARSLGIDLRFVVTGNSSS